MVSYNSDDRVLYLPVFMARMLAYEGWLLIAAGWGGSWQPVSRNVEIGRPAAGVRRIERQAVLGCDATPCKSGLFGLPRLLGVELEEVGDDLLLVAPAWSVSGEPFGGRPVYCHFRHPRFWDCLMEKCDSVPGSPKSANGAGTGLVPSYIGGGPATPPRAVCGLDIAEVGESPVDPDAAVVVTV